MSIPVHAFETALTRQAEVRVEVMRLDKVHAQISGNKWFKLKPAVEQAARAGLPLLSFGGAWSNHIHALAFAGFKLGIPTIGVIRGESAYADNPTLSDARKWGMELHFVDRTTYRRRKDPDFQQQLEARFGPVVLVPEGGSQVSAVHSVASLWQHPHLKSSRYDQVVLPVGTGGTMAGVIAGASRGVHVLGVSVLKQDGWLETDIEMLLAEAGVQPVCRWSLMQEGHGGGYARLPGELAAGLKRVESACGLELDPVYTVKALMALQRSIVQRRIKPHSRILVLHTGGLQGKRGFKDQLGPGAPEFVGPLAL
ncbi:pyridoxal-phosphate dependent enzyme [Marinobacterium sp. AK62]|uniref:Pyridoxal-phosphate dependent enzyme n=1 Tax=Marinobacterium alkalitolerans TaxID=1542925 RepID=A0ABS3ZDY7_9GAMM|nr:pyridoxal-phosphate dependent enzyme [Marinobacterium alkalitolerans]MBP0049530.1 pyridoxal-phosphate dependent enzyme [Marinobacterium alkalitolerans]